jgi:hypothetical protein
MRITMTDATATISVQGNQWPIDPDKLYDAIVERFGDQADDVWSLLQAVRSVPAAPDAEGPALRRALIRHANETFCKYDASVVGELLDRTAALRDNR